MAGLIKSAVDGFGHCLSTMGSDIRGLAIGAETSRDLNRGKLYNSPLFCGGVSLRSDGDPAMPTGLEYKDPAADFLSGKTNYQMGGKDIANRIAKYGMYGVAGISWIKFLKDPSFENLLLAGITTVASLAIGKKLDQNLADRQQAAAQGKTEQEVKSERKTDKQTKKANKTYKKKLDKSSLEKRTNQDGSSTYLINYDKHDEKNGGLLYGAVKVDKNGKTIAKTQYTYDKNHQLNGVNTYSYDQNGRQQGAKHYTPDQFEKLHPGIKQEVSRRNEKTLRKDKRKTQTKTPKKQKTQSMGMQRTRGGMPPLRTV